jgi:ribosomal protein L22
MASISAQSELDSTNPRNPVLEQYLKNKPTTGQLSRNAADIAKNSIFVDVEKIPGKRPLTKLRNTEHMNVILDPDPHGRIRWERKMIIRQIRRRGRLTKAQLLKRTERESLSKSQTIKTSVKKLGMLARQIMGKPIEEAITQMRFSPKKAAKAVAQHLKFARAEAIVKRGMGLGEAEGRKGEPVEIELKDGKRKLITDRTGIYVDQAWVGKGQHQTAFDYRARGRVHLMRLPYTSELIMRICCKLCANFVSRHISSAEGGGYENPAIGGTSEEEKQEALGAIA